MGIEAVVLLLALAGLSGGRRRRPRQHGPARTVPDLPSVVPPGLPPAGRKDPGYDPKSKPPAPVTTQLGPGDGYVIKNPDRAWGTAEAIRSLRDAIAEFLQCAADLELDPTYTIRVADISRQGGGKLPPHLSHHEGRDVDVSIQGHKLPLDALPCLLVSFLRDENTRVVFLDWKTQGEVWKAIEGGPFEGLRTELQWPLAAGTGRTRVRHSKGHANHLHVRFKA